MSVYKRALTKAKEEANKKEIDAQTASKIIANAEKNLESKLYLKEVSKAKKRKEEAARKAAEGAAKAASAASAKRAQGLEAAKARQAAAAAAKAASEASAIRSGGIEIEKIGRQIEAANAQQAEVNAALQKLQTESENSLKPLFIIGLFAVAGYLILNRKKKKRG